MGYAKRVDSNHAEMKGAFQRLGCSVLDLSRVGSSVPDLLIAFGCVAVLVEVKTPKGRVKPGQEAFRREWGGWAAIARDMADVEGIVARMREIHRRTA